MARIWLFEHERVRLVRQRGGWRVPRGHGEGVLSDEGLALLDAEAERSQVRGRPAVAVSARGVLHAGGMVGILQAGGVTVELLPKVDRGRPDVDGARRNLLEMLTFSGALPPIAEPGARQRVDRVTLYETLIGLFASALRDALRGGLRQDYRPCVEDLGVVRGRLVFGEQIRRNTARPDRVVCAYHRYTVDTPLNRVLAWAVDIARRSTRDPDNRRRLQVVARALGDVPAVPQTAADCAAIHLDRLNRRFAEALRWATLLITGRGPTLRSGGRPSFSLLFDMSRVFEAYVSRVARKALGGDAVSVRSQAVIGHLVHRPRGRPRVKQQPDLVVRVTNGPRVVVDTKYKTFPGSVAASEGDLRQVYVYQRLLGSDAGPAQRAILLYPTTGAEREHRGWLLGRPAPGTHRVEVVVASVDIRGDGPTLRGRVGERLRALCLPTTLG